MTGVTSVTHPDVNEFITPQQLRSATLNINWLPLIAPHDDFILMFSSMVFMGILYFAVSPRITSFIDSAREAIALDLKSTSKSFSSKLPRVVKVKGFSQSVLRLYYQILSVGGALIITRPKRSEQQRLTRVSNAHLIKSILEHIEK